MKRSRLIAVILVLALFVGVVNLKSANAAEDKDGDGDVDLFDVALEAAGEILTEFGDEIAEVAAPYVEEYITKPVKNWWNGEPEPQPEPKKEESSWWWPF